MKKVVLILFFTILIAGKLNAKVGITAIFPADGMKDVNTGVLEWSGRDGSRFDLYFSADAEPKLYKSNLKDAVEKPVIIELNKKYFWKVVEKNGTTIIGTSKVFSFTTLPIKLNPAVSYKPFVDSRDGKVYWTVKIGGKEWMVQNLDYDLNGNSWYYGDSEKNKIHGRLYPGTAVGMDEKKLCPAGWRIPSEDDWNELFSALGGERDAGAGLKDSSGLYWSKSKNLCDNQSGMTMLPSGSRDSKPSYSNLGKYAFFWTSTSVPKKPEHYYKVDLGFMRDKVNISAGSQKWSYSIRCVRD